MRRFSIFVHKAVNSAGGKYSKLSSLSPRATTATKVTHKLSTARPRFVPSRLWKNSPKLTAVIGGFPWFPQGLLLLLLLFNKLIATVINLLFIYNQPLVIRCGERG